MHGNVGFVTVLAPASVVCSAGIIYPFKPFKKRWVALVSILACFVLVGVFAPKNTPAEAPTDPNPRPWAASEDDGKFWVTSERLNRRTCPSDSCGVVGQFFFREGTTILERRDGWARVTEPYDASCANGRSEYVDTGNAACDPANGINDGKFAEWVSVRYLSDTRPPDPAAGASGTEELVAGSDDFAIPNRFRRSRPIPHCTRSMHRTRLPRYGRLGKIVQSSQPTYLLHLLRRRDRS